MSDKPTFKEFWTNRKYYFIKTEDDRYFVIKNYKLWMIVFIILYMAAYGLCLTTPQILYIKGHVWPNTIFEGAILLFPLFFLIHKLLYKLMKFREIGQDNDDFLEADDVLRPVV